MFKSSVLIFAMLVCALRIDAQEKLIYVRSAESLSYDREKTDAKILRGNVVCEHEGALLHCDTAYFFEEKNRIVARGNVLITKGDSIRVTGRTLNYEGKTRMATLEGNVRCVEKDMTLTTQLLTFDVGRSIANYYNGGTIVNRENTLVSKNGHYYSGTKEATFHYDVVLTNPDYVMNCDTLKYRVPSRTAYFLGPGIIRSKTDYIYCENGWYDTNRQKAQFSTNAVLVTPTQKLRGDSLVFDRVASTGEAFRNVSLLDTTHHSVIYGDRVFYQEKGSLALVTGHAVYARKIEVDTLFIGADTLLHRDLDSTTRFLTAFHHVRIFKKDIQAACDSASFNTRDSLLSLFGGPLLWSGRMQGTSRLITVSVGNQSIRSFSLDGKAFLVQQADSLRNRDKFNQLSGRSITGNLVRDTIRTMLVEGNAEMLYYPASKGGGVIGLNRTRCTAIRMAFEHGDVSRITLTPLTTGQVDPLRQVDIENAKLKGFGWNESKRPPSRFKLHPGD